MTRPIDLFRCTVSPEAGPALARLFEPDADGRTYVGQGPRVDLFERCFSVLTGLDSELPVLGVNSCSAAIDLALHLCEVGPGDEVIATPITCSASNGPIVTRRARISWADVDPLTGNMDPSSVSRLVTTRTRAIIAVDWAGRSCDYEALRRVTRGRIPIIQDAAHRLYIDPSNRGDYVAWSFGPIKHLTMGGYGGALLPPIEEYDRARLLRWHGLDRLSKADFRCSQDIVEVGYRYHLTDDQATVGLLNLPLAIASVARARENAAWYMVALGGLPDITLPPFDPRCDYWIFTILLRNSDARARLVEALAKQRIASSQVHARNDRHTAFMRAARHGGGLPGTSRFDSRQLSIPVGAWVSPEDRLRVAETIRAWADSEAGARDDDDAGLEDSDGDLAERAHTTPEPARR